MDNNLKKIIEWPICLDILNDPRILICGHTYCMKCIYSIYNYNNNNYITCSLYNKTSRIYEGNIINIPVNYIITDLISIYNKKSIDIIDKNNAILNNDNIKNIENKKYRKLKKISCSLCCISAISRFTSSDDD